MAKPAKTNEAARTAGGQWWLAVGEEDCPHCDLTYSYRVETRCFECDGPLCPMCIVRVEEHLVCPGCREAGSAR